MLKLSAKCWISTFNAQGLREIIVVEVWAVKIYVIVVEVFWIKERKGETHETIKIDGFVSFTPHWMLMYFCVGFF
jgi:hypothetical protein